MGQKVQTRATSYVLRCIDKKGGVCLLECDIDDHCRGGYSCKDEDREGAGGKASVCID